MLDQLLGTGATEAETELYESNGPLWYRGWALESEEKVCADVDDVLARTGTRRMIMGHTPDFQVWETLHFQMLYSKYRLCTIEGDQV